MTFVKRRDEAYLDATLAGLAYETGRKLHRAKQPTVNGLAPDLRDRVEQVFIRDGVLRLGDDNPRIYELVKPYVEIANLNSVGENTGTIPLHCMFHWQRSGFPTFRLTGGLTCALSLTDSKTTAAEAGLPYRSLRIEVDPVAFPLLGTYAIHIARSFVPHSTGHLDVVQLCCFGRTHMWSWRPADLEIDTCNFVALPPAEHAALMACWRVAVNLGAYLEAHKAEVTAARRLVKGPRGHVDDPAPLTVWEIGREIKLAPQMREAARICNSGRAGFELTKRFIVRGHWREQPCGPGRAERKRVWIQPFWKGPADGVALLRNYTVGA